ncbi:hypothetical protein V2I01_31475 [Micromonospora sp. BRA006-A]|nr:hypothetical protein [Micromonospora sp. BRA006-A]
MPVPPAIFETPLGLHYLHARGTHALAAGSPEAALADFQLCGQLMQRWQLDFSGLVPWRTESARALLRMGRRQQARKLVRDELARLRPVHVRYRAAALRVLAATEEDRNGSRTCAAPYGYCGSAATGWNWRTTLPISVTPTSRPATDGRPAPRPGRPGLSRRSAASRRCGPATCPPETVPPAAGRVRRSWSRA